MRAAVLMTAHAGAGGRQDTLRSLLHIGRYGVLIRHCKPGDRARRTSCWLQSAGRELTMNDGSYEPVVLT
jgi:hypothetical protein